MIRTCAVSLMIAATFAAAPALAQQASPVGLWRTISDQTGKPKSLVRITERGGEYQGTIEKLFREAGENPHPVCGKCEGELKDKPVLGMLILTGIRQDGADYGGGKILDPNDGKTYQSRLTLVEDGRKLNVRGYIGTPMLGRTQVWIREE